MCCHYHSAKYKCRCMRCKGLWVVCVVGVEGVMRSCCEKTMGVLRQNKESLITIIEVLNIQKVILVQFTSMAHARQHTEILL